MKRPWHIWLVFALGLVVVFAAMGWISAAALRLDRREADAQVRAAYEENVRLALWRMDSALAPLLAQENARPYFTYTAFYPLERAYTRMFSDIQYGDVLVPSPLLQQPVPQVLLHFQFTPDGQLTSPQVPTGNMRDLAESRYVAPEQVQAAVQRLAQLQKAVDRAALAACLPAPEPASPVLALSGATTRPLHVVLDGRFHVAGNLNLDAQGLPNPSQYLANTGQNNAEALNPRERVSPAYQKARNDVEYISLSQNIASNSALAQQEQQLNLTLANAGTANLEVRAGMLQPLWAGDLLLLTRRVTMAGGEYLQGCWLDWSAIHAALLTLTRDLLPNARLEPVVGYPSSPNGESRRLASLPVRLAPGTVPAPPTHAGLSPVQLTLLTAWGGVLLAAAAVGVMLRGVIALSERRGSFVSAVTHELRTPLTTFRLYTEMLAEGMVRDEDKRRAYLNTLRVEAQRLGHLVENVLAYARLERGRAADRLEVVSLGELVNRVQGRLADRAQQAGMELVVDVAGDLRDDKVRVRGSSVEQVLFNLVDNACKYAACATDKRIHLEAACAQGATALRVRDHGPGITPQEARQLFRPFSKNVRQAAQSAPGVGLGLALSRRLARDLGGNLRLDGSVKDGACFELILPAA